MNIHYDVGNDLLHVKRCLTTLLITKKKVNQILEQKNIKRLRPQTVPSPVPYPCALQGLGAPSLLAVKEMISTPCSTSTTRNSK